MLFMDAAAPVGWTKDVVHNNKALRIVSGTGGAAGGTTAFSTVFALRTSPTTGATVLTEAMIPSHAHTFSDTSGSNSVSHTHSFSDTSGTGSANHDHTVTRYTSLITTEGGSGAGSMWQGATSVNSGADGAAHTHAIGGTTGSQSANHTHVIGGTTSTIGSDGSHTHPGVASAFDFAVQYVDSIICNKD